MIFRSRSTPKEVFTPRAAAVNPDMYVSRPSLEKRLGRAVDSTQHLIIFGDSGSGKTWLYKQYFQENRVPYRLVDLAIASTDSLDAAFIDAVDNQQGWSPVEMTETREGGVDLGVTATESREITYRNTDSSFDKLLADFSRERGKPKFLVLDNLEQVATNDEVIQAIANYIIRLDNPRFAATGIRFLLVGVIADMRELVARYDQAGTVANRLAELPEVQRLTYEEAHQLVMRGFQDKLQCEVFSEDELVASFDKWTQSNAQQIHSLGYQVACEAQEENWHVSPEALARGKDLWIEESLAQHVSMIENRLNKNEARWQRRNQVLYCLGQTEGPVITAPDIDAEVRREFSHTIEVDRLGIDQILADLAKGDNPILIKNPTERSFRFAHPKLRLAIRTMLFTNDDGDVERRR